MSERPTSHLTLVGRIVSLFVREQAPGGRSRFFPVFAAATLTIGLPLWLVFAFGFMQATPPIDRWKTIHWAVVFGSSWILISPALVARWELSALAGALAQLKARVQGQGAQIDLADQLRRAWPIAHVPSSLLVAVFAATCFLMYRSALTGDFAIPSGSPAFWLTLIILLATGSITGIGVAGVIFATWALRRICCGQLDWQPFHADQRGGCGFLADFSMETAVLFSCGSVLVPAAVAVGVSVGWPFNIAIYGFCLLYAVLIILIFAWPVTMLSLNGERCRQQYLADYSQSIAFAIANSRSNVSGERSPLTLADLDRAATHIAPAERLIYMFEKVAQRSVLPFRAGLLVRVLAAGAAPIALMLVQLLIERAFLK